jgi:hypothetical protein
MGGRSGPTAPPDEGGLHPQGCNAVEDPAQPGCGTPRRGYRAVTPTRQFECRRHNAAPRSGASAANQRAALPSVIGAAPKPLS